VTGIVAAVLTLGPAAQRTPGAGAPESAAQPARGAQAGAAQAALARAAERDPLPGGTASGAGSVHAGPPVPAASAASPAGAASPVSLVLTAADRRRCPAAATACVDLASHITWLQAGGKVTFGPVQMEPGKPGGGHETPRGTFNVAWKAGAVYESNIYHEPMPWATFFAAGGIAFHGGPLTEWSHGCVHLTDSNAHYYNLHLPIGAEVVVF
jgi:lipoprotein-anchoring transpeptidase ErfK/SrfK